MVAQSSSIPKVGTYCTIPSLQVSRYLAAQLQIPALLVQIEQPKVALAAGQQAAALLVVHPGPFVSRHTITMTQYMQASVKPRYR